MKLMLDLETMGTSPNSPILSIGAVTFCNEHLPSKSFYSKIKYESCIDAGLVPDPETAKWWAEQPKEVYEEAMSGNTPLQAALYQLTDFISSLPSELEIYANGSDFDFPILVNAYKKLRIPVPWKYHTVRDYRTLRKIFYYVLPGRENTAKHNALRMQSIRQNIVKLY